MKITEFTLDAPAWAGIGSIRRSTIGAPERASAGDRSLTLLERFDRWLWKQHVREREAYLADSRDIFELEERIRRLERSVGGRYC